MGQCCSGGTSSGGDSSAAKSTELVPKTEDEQPAPDQQKNEAEATEQPAAATAVDSEEKPVVLVLGASGLVGSATLLCLSSKFADKVDIRAGTRDPGSADKVKDVTVVQASMAIEDKENLIATLKGVSTLYIVVPGVQNRGELSVSVAEAAKEAGVKHIVAVSTPLAAESEDTIFGGQFREVEVGVSALGIPCTFLRLPYFMDNYLNFAATVKENGQFYVPLSGDKPLLSMSVSDAGQASADVLVDPAKHEGKTYTIISARDTMDEIATTLTSVLEKEVTFVRGEMDATKETYMGFGMPEWQVDGLLELFKLTEEGAPSLNLQDMGDFKSITGEEPTSLKDFLTGFVDAFK